MKVFFYKALFIILLSSCSYGPDSGPCAGKLYNTPSMVVDGYSHIYVSFYSKYKNQDPTAEECVANSDGPYDLNFAISTDRGRSWSSSLVKRAVSSTGSAEGFYPQSISVSPVNRNDIYIAFIDSEGLLNCAYSSDRGISWLTKVVDETLNTTVKSYAISSTSSGQVYIVYHAIENNVSKLKYAKSSNKGLTWTDGYIDTSSDTGYNPSVFIDNTYMHISYRRAGNTTNSGLWYARYNLSDSNIFRTQINTLSTSSGVLSSITGSSSSGLHIAFYEPQSYSSPVRDDGKINIVSSSNNGNNWSSSLVVDIRNYTGKAVSAASFGDKIYLSYGFYRPGIENKLMFAYSEDAGTSFTLRNLELGTNLTPTTGTSTIPYLNSSLVVLHENLVDKLYLIYASGLSMTFKSSDNKGEDWTVYRLTL